MAQITAPSMDFSECFTDVKHLSTTLPPVYRVGAKLIRGMIVVRVIANTTDSFYEFFTAAPSDELLRLVDVEMTKPDGTDEIELQLIVWEKGSTVSLFAKWVEAGISRRICFIPKDQMPARIHARLGNLENPF